METEYSPYCFIIKGHGQKKFMPFSVIPSF